VFTEVITLLSNLSMLTLGLAFLSKSIALCETLLGQQVSLFRCDWVQLLLVGIYTTSTGGGTVRHGCSSCNTTNHRFLLKRKDVMG
jgi:hypothetical protein